MDFSACSCSATDQTVMWHRRPVTLNNHDLNQPQVYVKDVPRLEMNLNVCQACHTGKAHKLPFVGIFALASNVGEIFRSDIVGEVDASFPEGFKYFFTFIDNHSWSTFVAFLHPEGETQTAFAKVLPKIRTWVFVGNEITAYDKKTTINSDEGKKYELLVNTLYDFNLEKTFLPPYAPELNAIAEMVNRTVVESARVLLIQAELPKYFWAFALRYAVFVRSMVPHTASEILPS